MELSIHSDDPGSEGGSEIDTPRLVVETEEIGGLLHWTTDDLSFVVPPGSPVSHIGAWSASGAWIGSFMLQRPREARERVYAFRPSGMILSFAGQAADEPEEVEPPTPLPPVFQPEPIPNKKLLMNVVGELPVTWGADRWQGQWVIAGNIFNVGKRLDRLRRGDGHGLKWESDDVTVKSFEMEDGRTERITQSEYRGVKVVDCSVQFVDDGSYDKEANTPLYNRSLKVPPSDQLLHDGTRFQYSLLEPVNRFRVGRHNPHTVTYATAFVVEPWMGLSTYHTGPLDAHEPTNKLPSPLACSLRNSKFTVTSRDADRVLVGASPRRPNETTQLAEFDLPEVGEWASVILRFRIDPAKAGAGSGFMELYFLGADGSLHKAGEQGAEWGYAFEDDLRNSDFFLNTMQFYGFHQHTPGPRNNWDAKFGNVRRMRTAVASYWRGTGVTIEQGADHLRAHIGL